MKIDRHNWGQVNPPSNDLVCVGPYRAIASRTDATCNGCGAVVPMNEFDNEIAYLGKADLLWHEKYRPMAALVALVEEARE